MGEEKERVSKMVEKKSRAEKAGEQLGNAISEMANLMYQNNTKSNFYRGLLAALNKGGDEEGQMKKSCKTCKYEDGPTFSKPCLTCSSELDFNNWERKGEEDKE